MKKSTLILLLPTHPNPAGLTSRKPSPRSPLIGGLIPEVVSPVARVLFASLRRRKPHPVSSRTSPITTYFDDRRAGRYYSPPPPLPQDRTPSAPKDYPKHPLFYNRPQALPPALMKLAMAGVAARGRSPSISTVSPLPPSYREKPDFNGDPISPILSPSPIARQAVDIDDDESDVRLVERLRNPRPRRRQTAQGDTTPSDGLVRGLAEKVFEMMESGTSNRVSHALSPL